MGRGQTIGWPGTVRARLDFERGASTAYPSLQGRRASRCSSIAFRYRVDIAVAGHDTMRHVIIEFPVDSLEPRVRVDGPTESPHRFDDGSLCMWVPTHPRTRRWVLSHGLLDLLDTIQGHLFREAWWREHGEWLGPELAHGPRPIDTTATRSTGEAG